MFRVLKLQSERNQIVYQNQHQRQFRIIQIQSAETAI